MEVIYNLFTMADIDTIAILDRDSGRVWDCDKDAPGRFCVCTGTASDPGPAFHGHGDDIRTLLEAAYEFAKPSESSPISDDLFDVRF